MKHAIAVLESALMNLATNENIHRQTGDINQANRESRQAGECRQALAVLRAATNGPIGAYVAGNTAGVSESQPRTSLPSNCPICPEPAAQS